MAFGLKSVCYESAQSLLMNHKARNAIYTNTKL